MTIRATIALLLLTFLFGEPAHARPPTDSWSANLNAKCEPYDVVDWLRSKMTPETFWTEQEKDFRTFVKAATTNLMNARLLLNENRDGIQQFRAMVVRKAQELNIRGAKAREMIKDNMEDWDKIALTFRKNIKRNEAELAWAKSCLAVAGKKLRDMGYIGIGR